MKKVILAVLAMVFTLSATESKAQTWDEWFRQKKTQNKYLVQQIAALKVYIGYAKKGYKIAKDGLQTVGDHTGKEFDLHKEHFNSLTMVNPEIKQHPKATQIMTMRNRIIADYHTTYQQLQSSNAFSKEELDYIRRVYNRLLDDCQNTINQLDKVLSDRIIEMTDDQRMERIEKLYTDMKGNYAFSRAFANDTKGLALSRMQEEKQIEISRKWHGIN